METLTPPKSKQETDQWFGNIHGGCPSRPTVTEVNEFAEVPIFVHPAEKPQNDDPGNRTKLYEPIK
ncbi:MAG TPA: hypothetical protein VGD17_13160 [Chitinophagaceae bacterium]